MAVVSPRLPMHVVESIPPPCARSDGWRCLPRFANALQRAPRIPIPQSDVRGSARHPSCPGHGIRAIRRTENEFSRAVMEAVFCRIPLDTGHARIDTERNHWHLDLL